MKQAAQSKGYEPTPQDHALRKATLLDTLRTVLVTILLCALQFIAVTRGPQILDLISSL